MQAPVVHIAMISVENFYWILHENLLKPVGMDAWYFYPFGTTDNLSRDEFVPETPGCLTPHVLFHFDQEPIFGNTVWGEYDRGWHRGYWSGKILRILANSEHSAVKKHMCQSRLMQDWYFFYHGFAALDWFGDSKYLGHSIDFVQKFSSYNHLVTGKRAYRMALTAKLLQMQMHHESDISFHGTPEQCEAEINDPCSKLSVDQKQLIQRYLCGNHAVPMLLDRSKIDGQASANFGHQEYKLWQRSFLHVVNETVFYDAKLHLTEKIFKPIVSQRPFILVAAPGNLAYLRRYGFKTFGRWIDESYDLEPDPVKRLDLIAHEIAKINNKPMIELRQMHQEMQPILDHNKSHFFGGFKEIIVDELVDNFDGCVKIWNNGRIDGRSVPSHPDLESVKQMLLR